METPARFCYACNDSYSGELDLCPECGQKLAGFQDMATPRNPTAGIAAAALDGVTEPRVRPSPPIVHVHEEDPDGPKAPAADPLIGRRLGIYLIQRFAGRGGMSRVYLAQHLNLERPCAIKVLSADLVKRFPQHVELFFSEARAAASLVHPNVVTVHNILEHDGLHLIEMEWIEGRSLSRLLLDNGRLSPYQATVIMNQVASGLAAAHRNHIVHRDLKPSNVLLQQDGRPKLADFGLARRLMAPGRLSSKLAGTPYYMAPELFRGRQASPRSDVYAAGVTFYLLLTGLFPFRAPGLPELARLHLAARIPDPRRHFEDVPECLVQVINTALAKRELDRYADSVELHEELRRALGRIRSLASLLDEALTGLDLSWTRRSDGGFVVDVRLPRGRHQKVFVETLGSALSAEELVRISSPCAPVDDSYFERALELNARVHHGAIAIEEVEAQRYFVMRNAYPRTTCNPEELRRSVLEVAGAADEVEELLLGGDRH